MNFLIEPMYMADYVKQLDGVFAAMGRGVLHGSGSRSHKQAMEKAENEYRKYQVRVLSPVEVAYFESLKETERKLSRGKKQRQLSNNES